MGELTDNAIREIEQIHSTWIASELAGDTHSAIALCADDIELWPPNAQPVLGRAAVARRAPRRSTPST